MPEPSSDSWSRLREARLVRVLIVYLAAAWVALQLTAVLREELQLPRWVTPSALVLLLVGLIVVCLAVWLQELGARRRERARLGVPDGATDQSTLSAEAAEASEGALSTDGAVVDVSEPHPGWGLSRLTWGRFAFGALMAFALLFGLAGLFVLIKGRGGPLSPATAEAEAAPGIAVLPFRVSGQNLDVWREGMVDLLSVNLDEVAGLRAIDSRTVLARWREQVQGSETDDLADALEVARRAGARYALVGSAVSIGKDVRLAADIYDVSGGKSLWQGQVEGSPDEVLELVDRLSLDILRALVSQKPGSASPRVHLANVTTSSVPALKAFLQGEALMRRADFAQAIPHFERAVSADSTFALAYYRLATAYGWMYGLTAPANRENMERAARFIERLPERERILVRGGLALDRGTLDGIEPLRQASERFPDDAEIWYQLGDTYHHLGGEALVTRAATDSAFAKTIALDPTFSPAYIHLVENAFFEADSARIVQLVTAYDSLARETGSSGFERRNRLALTLVYGDEAVRAAAFAELDTLPSRDVSNVMGVLRHPMFLEDAERLARMLLNRSDPLGRQIGSTTLLFISLSRGKLRDVREFLANDPVLRPFAGPLFYSMSRYGVPIDRAELERTLVVPAVTSAPDVGQFYGPGLTIFYAGAFAAENRDWTTHEAAIKHLRGYAQSFLEKADSTGARYADAVAEALEGYGVWRRGRPEQALPVLRAAQQRATSVVRADVNGIIRYWLADLLIELRRLEEAKVYLVSLLDNPIARYRLGEVHEQLGEVEEAREQYELFARAMKDVDPELRPALENALNAAKRLRSVIKE
jgi:tetratricopeptide (TPR) repeat protein